MRKTKTLILLLYYILLTVALLFLNILTNPSNLAYWLLTAFMPLIPYLISKLINHKIDDLVIIIYNIFIIFSMIGGNIFGFYRFIGYDKFLHTLSGVIIGLIAFTIYSYLNNGIKLNNKNELILNILFVEGINSFVAFIWECFEFILLVFFNNDAIHHYDKGVYDTMNDMIVCFIGSLFVIYFIVHNYITHKNNILTTSVNNIIQNKKVR